MNATMSVEYAEDAMSLSGENTSRQKWLSNDVNKEELLVNIKCFFMIIFMIKDQNTLK